MHVIHSSQSVLAMEVNGIASFERKNIARMHGYTPGEQPSSLDVIKLNTNENPYPPSEPVMDALKNVAAGAWSIL